MDIVKAIDLKSTITMDTIMTDSIQLKQSEHLTEIIFNRPEKKNALTGDMYNAMTSALKTAKEDDAVRVVTFSGADGCFTAGNDIADFLQHPPGSADSPVLLFLNEIINFPKALVAAVDGLAIGIGTTLLLHCDLVYATPAASFRLPFVNLGLTPEAGSSFILPQMLGHQKAAELLLLGEFFDAKTAQEIGFVNEVVTRKSLPEKIDQVIAKLITQPSQALQQTKSLMKRPHQAAFNEHLIYEGKTFAERIVSTEALGIMQAFMSKPSN